MCSAEPSLAVATSRAGDGSTVLTDNAWNADDNLASRTDGTQGTTAFSYDWADRQTVIDPPDAYVAGTVTRSYRLDGLLATQAFPSSITETPAYDGAKRPVSISLGSAGSISQAFDRAGNVTSDGRSLTGITGDAGTGTQSFSYDDLSRLAGSTGLAVSRSYQYDLDGNRTRRIPTIDASCRPQPGQVRLAMLAWQASTSVTLSDPRR